MTATKKPQPHRCGVCHSCKKPLTNGQLSLHCANLLCERFSIEPHLNLHGEKDSPYRGRCPKVTR